MPKAASASACASASASTSRWPAPWIFTPIPATRCWPMPTWCWAACAIRMTTRANGAAHWCNWRCATARANRCAAGISACRWPCRCRRKTPWTKGRLPPWRTGAGAARRPMRARACSISACWAAFPTPTATAAAPACWSRAAMARRPAPRLRNWRRWCGATMPPCWRRFPARPSCSPCWAVCSTMAAPWCWPMWATIPGPAAPATTRGCCRCCWSNLTRLPPAS